MNFIKSFLIGAIAVSTVAMTGCSSNTPYVGDGRDVNRNMTDGRSISRNASDDTVVSRDGRSVRRDGRSVSRDGRSINR